MHFVIVPGINGSGPGHWQSIWQDVWGPSASRIGPSSWDEPELADWCLALDRAVRQAQSAEVVLVAHSLGCLTAGHWLRQAQRGIRGAFLVAPPDVAGPNFPAEAPSFATLKAASLPVPGLVISSDDDPYCTPEAAQRLAASWGAGHVSVGPAGHINTASGQGAWESGRLLLDAFTAGLGHQAR